jgi:hypothetical protein
MTAEGGCHCGAVRYVVEGAPARVGLCHCLDCRRHAGAPMVAWAIFPEARVRRLAGVTAEYASSEHGRRHFCPACGTGLFYTNAVIFGGMVDVQLATLDDPGLFPPTEQIQLADRIPWMARAHELQGFERYPET